MEQQDLTSTNDAKYLKEPKTEPSAEMSGDQEITYINNNKRKVDEQDIVTELDLKLKEEMSDSDDQKLSYFITITGEADNSVHSGTADLDEHAAMIMPIKTETVLNEKIVELQNMLAASGNAETSTSVAIVQLMETHAKMQTSKDETSSDSNHLLLKCKHVFQKCPFTTNSEEALVKHFATEHTFPNLCKFCNFKCLDSIAMSRHVRIQHGKKPYQCTTCGCKFPFPSSLKTHIRSHTGKNPYFCDKCDYKASMKRYLIIHMRTHTDEKLLSCKLCDFKCARPHYFKIHMTTHTGDNPFSCQHCPYKCSQKPLLYQHMKRHNGKAFVCDYCYARYRTKTSFIQHIRDHTDNNRYSCKQCSYKTHFKIHLDNHMRTHTGEKPFACNICGHRVSSNNSLLKHMSRKHTTRVVKHIRSRHTTSVAKHMRSSHATSGAKHMRSSHTTSVAKHMKSSYTTSVAKHVRNSHTTSVAKHVRSSQTTSAKCSAAKTSEHQLTTPLTHTGETSYSSRPFRFELDEMD